MGSTLAASSPPPSSSVTPQQAENWTAARPAMINRTTIHLLLCFVGLTRPLLYLSARCRRGPSVFFVHRGYRGGVSLSDPAQLWQAPRPPGSAPRRPSGAAARAPEPSPT